MLPPEILSEILIHSDIEDVSKFCRLNKNNVCDTQFWIKKFNQDGLFLPYDYNEIHNLNTWVKFYKRSQIYTPVYKNLKSGMKYILEFNYDEGVKFQPVIRVLNETFFKMYISDDDFIIKGYTNNVHTYSITPTNNDDMIENTGMITDFIILFPYKEIIQIGDEITIKSKSILTTIYNTLAYYY